MDNSFAHKYRKLSNRELLALLDNKEDYTHEAIEAARDEIALRGINQEEIDAFQQEKVLAAELEAERLRKAEEQKKQARELAQSALRGFNTKKEDRLTRLLIGILAGCFGLIALFQIAVEAELFIWMFTDDLAEWDISMLFYFLPIVFLAVAVVSFFLRKKTGWLLMGTYLIYGAVMAIHGVVLSLDSGPELPQFDLLFPRANPLMFVFKLFFWAGSFWMINLPFIKTVYESGKKEFIRAIVLGVLWALFAIFSF